MPTTRRKLLDQPQEVIRRWIRIKMIGKAAVLARAYMRLRLRLKERKRWKALQGAFNAIKDQAIKCEHKRYEALRTIFNIALYILLIERDIQSLKIDALTHPDEWTRKLCARLILLAIYEWDIDKVSGVALRDALMTIRVAEEVKTEAVEALRAVRAVQGKAKKKFSALRHATIAHRDPDALAQYRAIRNLRTEEVLATAAEFYAGAERFIAVVPRMMHESSSGMR
jgi:hypothetical protein